jgi:cobalamin biosynthetic protein CobC
MPDLIERSGLPQHGGDLAFATARHGLPAQGWLDLSIGVNPAPYPASAVLLDQLARLPDPESLAVLHDAARTAYGVPGGVVLAAAPGTELLIRLLPVVAPAGAAAVLGPTYGSHAAAWRSGGRAVILVGDLRDVPSDAAIVVVCNPNNPDGRTFAPAQLADIARGMMARGGLLVVDEAFADVTPEMSLVPVLAGLPAVVLRSFGKFYGLAGLRLGFATGAAAVVEGLATLLGAWPVSGPALAIGSAALADTRWREATRASLRQQSADLRALLVRHRLLVKGGTDLFALVEDASARTLHTRLAGHGIWTRAFADQPSWLRFGLPGPGLPRLEEALSACR